MLVLIALNIVLASSYLCCASPFSSKLCLYLRDLKSGKSCCSSDLRFASSYSRWPMSQSPSWPICLLNSLASSRALTFSNGLLLFWFVSFNSFLESASSGSLSSSLALSVAALTFDSYLAMRAYSASRSDQRSAKAGVTGSFCNVLFWGRSWISSWPTEISPVSYMFVPWFDGCCLALASWEELDEPCFSLRPIAFSLSAKKVCLAWTKPNLAPWGRL